MSRRDRISDFTRPVSRSARSNHRRPVIMSVAEVHASSSRANMNNKAQNLDFKIRNPNSVPTKPRQDKSRVLRRQGLKKLPPFTPIKTKRKPNIRLIASIGVVSIVMIVTPVLLYKSFINNSGFVQGVKKVVTGNDLPKYMTARSLMDVPAKVEPVSDTDNSALPATHLGWYQESARPGVAGTVLLVGKVTGDGGIGALRQIKNMKPDDMIRVETGDGGLFIYRVKTVKQFDPRDVTKDVLLASAEEGKNGLNIATIIDNGQPDQMYSSKRIIVYAVRE